MQDSWKRKFLFIWVGQFLSLITSSAVNFAIIIWLSLHFESAQVLAYGAIAGMLPAAVIGPFAGVYIDRWDRKKTMIFSDMFVALCTLAMSISFWVGFESLWLIYVMLGLRSVGSAFHMPAMQASIPMIAPKEELLRISGINQVIQSVSSIAGPALGALAITLMPIGQVLLLDIVGAVFAIVSLVFVNIPNPIHAEKSKTSFRQVSVDLRVGFLEIFRTKGLASVFVFSTIVTFFIMPIAVLFPLLTLNHFGGGKFEISVVEVVWGIGMLAGGSIIGIFKPSISKVVIMNVMYIFLGLSLSLSGYIPATAFILFVVLTGIAGIAASVYNACFMTIIQEQVRPEAMGRVFSMYFSIVVIPTVIGLLGTGWAADQFGVGNIFVVLGLLIALVGVVCFYNGPLMSLGVLKQKDAPH